MAKKLKLSNGGYTLVDNHLYDELNKFKWYDNGNGYVATSINGKKKLIHRYILKIDDVSIQIDHIDNDTKNNLTQNLRIVNHSQNLRNMAKMQIEIPGGFMTLDESAKFIKRRIGAIYYYIKIGKLKRYRVLGRALIKKSELEELVKIRQIDSND